MDYRSDNEQLRDKRGKKSHEITLSLFRHPLIIKPSEEDSLPNLISLRNIKSIPRSRSSQELTIDDNDEYIDGSRFKTLLHQKKTLVQH